MAIAIPRTFSFAAKRLGKSGIGHTIGRPMVRRLVTSNFASGKVALGECNHYFFPPRYVTVDMGSADYKMMFHGAFRLPFKDNSQSIVYAAHVLEHVGEGLPRLLREVRRVLRPGGGFRIEVPDAERLLVAYQTGDAQVLDHFRAARMKLLDLHGFDNRYLEDQLTLVGEIASYNDRSRNLVHIPAYATKLEVDEAIERGGLDAVATLATSRMDEGQSASGGHNGALYWSKLRDDLSAAGFSRIQRGSRNRTIVPGLKLGAGLRRVWDSIREKPHREFYSLYIDAIK